MKKEITIAISPCPNDTFIFGAMLNGYIKSDLDIEYYLYDVEQLNQLAIKKAIDVIKVSVAVYPYVKDNYKILRCGGAIGRGFGPILVSKKDFSQKDIKNLRLGIPGKHTTAYLLFKNAYPDFRGKVIDIRYDNIVPSLLKEEIDIGILIHETRFTYKDYGLKLIQDLGKWWEDTTNYPIPLGCILAKRELGNTMHNTIENLIKKSIDFAERNMDKIWNFIKDNAQEMDREIILKHINTFVNEFSKDMTDEGYNAIEKLVGLNEI